MPPKFRQCTVVIVLSLLVSMAAFSAPPAGAPAQDLPPLSPQIWPDLEGAGNGDQGKLKKIQALVSDRLAAKTKDPEAWVWQGALDLLGSGNAYRSGDLDQAGALWTQSLERMDEAVKLAPQDVSVRLVRGLMLLPVARIPEIPEPAENLLRRVREDFGFIAGLPRDAFAQMPLIIRATVLDGLGEAHDRLGNKAEARKAYQRVVDECKETPQYGTAAAWLEKQ